MQSKTGFPSSHQLKSYVASKSLLKFAARCPISGCWPSCNSRRHFAFLRTTSGWRYETNHFFASRMKRACGAEHFGISQFTIVVWLCFTWSHTGWQFLSTPWRYALPKSAWLYEAEMAPGYDFWPVTRPDPMIRPDPVLVRCETNAQQ